ncbi:MAG: DNA alkylation repair protein [Gemmatimonadetes bacterium]|nr:DNA alkylation repair protein [Gemmatimonadota bacterium]
MKAYMRNQFDFLGIKTPERRRAVRPLFARAARPAVGDLPGISAELFARTHREYQYVAVDLLDRYPGELPASFLQPAGELITTRSWWDTVDGLATHIVGDLARHHPAAARRRINSWRRSPDIWLRRTAILFQLGYKAETDTALLFDVIRENRTDREFFIRKAIGWALREYSKTDADAVVKFVRREQLDGLARREALKWLKAQGRLKESAT